MVFGPEMARAVNKFELSQELIRCEQSKWPDIRKSDDILVLDTRDIADPKVAQTVRNIEQIGKRKENQTTRWSNETK